MQDVEVGDPEFDRDFVIQGTDEGKLKDLFRSARLRQLIQTQPAFYMTVKDDEGWFGTTFPEGVDELYFQAHGVVKDVERLKGLYQVFAETLERLCEIGSAYEHDPRVEL
jgi:hypothetical protein